MNYQEIDIEDAPKAVQTWVKKLLESGQSVSDYKQHSGCTYVFVTLGKKNTTGYRIILEPEVLASGQLQITIREMEPAPLQFTAQVVNHPSILIRFDSDYREVRFQRR